MRAALTALLVFGLSGAVAAQTPAAYRLPRELFDVIPPATRVAGPPGRMRVVQGRCRPGQLEGFKKQAAECIRITREQDTRTLRYDWFLSRDGTQCEVREAYTDPEGLIEHNSHIVDARTKLFEHYADNHFMTVYGEPTPELTALVKAHHMEDQFQWFSFVKGLESPGA